MPFQTRAPKLLGEFGEGLVTYTLIRKGFEVAVVDHVGADLIAEKRGQRFAISVKLRLFRKASKESHMVVIGNDHIKKLNHFASQFGMQPLFAQAVCMADDCAIHLFIFQMDKIQNLLREVKHGFALSFGGENLEKLIVNPDIDYSCWSGEAIGNYDFGIPDEEDQK
jgi:hypothetical protein